MRKVTENGNALEEENDQWNTTTFLDLSSVNKLLTETFEYIS